MKIYIDELTLLEVLGLLIRLPMSIVDVVKEEWVWWTKFYKYEIYTPDEEMVRKKALAESRRRIRKRGRSR